MKLGDVFGRKGTPPDPTSRNLSMKWRNLAEFGGISAKFGEIWRGTGGIRRNLAENCEILAESGGKERNLAESGEIWRNLAKYF